jgi:regulatory protein
MAQALVRTRSARYGRLRLQQELQRRGVDRETIAASLPAPESESAVATAIWQRKFGQLPATAQERARQGRFLAARGFAASIIARILSVGEES